MACGDSDVNILKPRTDKRTYRRIVLPNDLEVLLISDPDTDKCAASMNVSVGSFSNPDGLEGLAHFLEHMLFYASVKYPEEDSYSKYISQHGGSTNAYTASEHTNFFFEVNCDSFEEALDRFAQFFIHPLMSPDATLREIKAVDSENQKNLLSDGWRMNQLQKYLSSKGHPYHKFGTGSWETLHVKPSENGVDTREQLVKFYLENYSANIMHLVIYGKESLDDIQVMAEEKFQVPNNKLRCVSFHGQPCALEHLQILVKAVPVKHGHVLNFVWPTTPEIRYYEKGPCTYLGHLIGHEGEGSLFSLLKKLGWATSLAAGEGDWSFEYSFFMVAIDLTDSGHEHMEDIVGLIFKYISLLKSSGVKEWIFDEIRAIRETEFHFKDKIRPIDYVARVASNMRLYPPHDWLVGSSLPSKFCPDTIYMILNDLTPHNLRIFWESKNFKGHTDMVEPWYKTEFSVEKITDAILQKWIDASPNDELHLPAPNLFIPTDLAIKEVQQVKYPFLLRKTSFSRLWYKPDTLFFTPKAFVKIDFSCPESHYSPDAEVLTDVFTRLLMDYLNDYAYDAEVAGLRYKISQSDFGFQLTLSGYNHKMKLLLDVIIEKVLRFDVKLERFSVIKESMVKEYENFKFTQPYQQAMYYCSLILEDNSWPWSEKLEALVHLEAEDLSKFSYLLLSRTFFECYAAGNIRPSEAEALVIDIETLLFHSPEHVSKALFASQFLTNRIVKLQTARSHFYPVQCLNQDNDNSALLFYIQVDPDDLVLNTKLQLFVLVAKQPAFHQLRTLEQLGYIAILMHRNDSGIRGLQFIVQSTVKDPGQLDERVEAFLKIFEDKLYALSIEEFENNVNALIEMKLEKHKNLRDESLFYWLEIEDGTFIFDRKEAEVAALRKLTRNDLIEFFDTYVRVRSPQRKKLSVQVFGGRHSAEYDGAICCNKHDSSVYRIDDIFSFRKSQALYGSVRGGFDLMKL
ncbi:unnamed protein product [Victoria cruziana]